MSARGPREVPNRKNCIGVSCQLTDGFTRHRLTIRGYVSTAAKHGVNAMTAILNAVTGNPWTPAHVNV